MESTDITNPIVPKMGDAFDLGEIVPLEDADQQIHEEWHIAKCLWDEED